MSRYEQAYETDWETLDKDEAIDRAYALGVAASLGEYHVDELEAIRGEMESAYDRSVIDLAFDEGKNEGRELDADDAGTNTVWSELVDGEKTTVDEDDIPTGGRSGLPDAIEKMKALERVEIDQREAVELPDFLQKE